MDNEDYNSTLNFLLEKCDSFSFVIRKYPKLTESESNVINTFSDYLLEENETAEWPGTTLLNSCAHIYYVKYTEETKKILSDSATDFSEWKHPFLPEDLCFYNNNIPIFASIAHENDSFFLDFNDPAGNHYDY